MRTCLDDLHADRIGHGVRVAEDPDLLDRVVDRGVPLEVCPVSNVALGVYSDLTSVPLPQLLAAGATVALGADDPLLFGSRLAAQYATMRAAHGLSDRELAELARMSVRASRAPEECAPRKRRHRRVAGRSRAPWSAGDMTNTPGDGQPPQDQRTSRRPPPALRPPAAPSPRRSGPSRAALLGPAAVRAAAAPRPAHSALRTGPLRSAHGVSGLPDGLRARTTPKATTTSLVLGILGVVLCSVLAPFAWKMGKQTVDEIDASQGQLGGRGAAQAGYIMGIIGTVLLGSSVLLVLLVVIVARVIGGGHQHLRRTAHPGGQPARARSRRAPAR